MIGTMALFSSLELGIEERPGMVHDAFGISKLSFLGRNTCLQIESLAWMGQSSMCIVVIYTFWPFRLCFAFELQGYRFDLCTFGDLQM